MKARPDEQRDARPREEPRHPDEHAPICRCPECDPDNYNDEQRDLGRTSFGGSWF